MSCEQRGDLVEVQYGEGENTAHTECLFYRDVVLPGPVHDYLHKD
jgi:hypothetical protein